MADEGNVGNGREAPTLAAAAASAAAADNFCMLNEMFCIIKAILIC
jgi:hypothetical protein